MFSQTGEVDQSISLPSMCHDRFIFLLNFYCVLYNKCLYGIYLVDRFICSDDFWSRGNHMAHKIGREITHQRTKSVFFI